MKKAIILSIIFIVVLTAVSASEITDLKPKNQFFSNSIDFYLVDGEKKMNDGYLSFIFEKFIIGFNDNTAEKYKNKISAVDVINLGNLYNSFTRYRAVVIMSGSFLPLTVGGGILFCALGYTRDALSPSDQMLDYTCGGLLFGTSLTFLAFFAVFMVYTVIYYNKYKGVKADIIKKLNGNDLSIKSRNIKIRFDIAVTG